MSLFPGSAGQLDPKVIRSYARAWRDDKADIQVQFMIYISSWWESMQIHNATAINPRPQIDGSILFETNQPALRWRYDVRQGSIQVVG
ncbi:MAG: hypothetical protein ACE5H9_02560 [Anaerolineae bacterium]